MKLIAVTIHLALGEIATSGNFSQNFIISSGAGYLCILPIEKTNYLPLYFAFCK